jgi:hypothetical protein
MAAKKSRSAKPWRKGLRIIEGLERLSCQVIDKEIRDRKPSETLLIDMLGMAVPLWMLDYEKISDEDRARLLKELNESDFAYRMQYVLHKGPKEGDTKDAFNDLAKCIALLSFCPGGVKTFGMHFEWKPKVVAVSKEESAESGKR